MGRGFEGFKGFEGFEGFEGFLVSGFKFQFLRI
jgi:hypothetical protein